MITRIFYNEFLTKKVDMYIYSLNDKLYLSKVAVELLPDFLDADVELRLSNFEIIWFNCSIVSVLSSKPSRLPNRFGIQSDEERF